MVAEVISVHTYAVINRVVYSNPERDYKCENKLRYKNIST